MASEQVLEVPMRRHVFDSERSFAAVLDGIFGGISQPDIEALFSKLAGGTSYEQFSSLVQQAQGRIGLMRFLQLDCDSVLILDPRADTGRRNPSGLRHSRQRDRSLPRRGRLRSRPATRHRGA